MGSFFYLLKGLTIYLNITMNYFSSGFLNKITLQLVPWIKHFSRKWHWWQGYSENGSKW
jgi:hypothetical protein